VNDLHAADKSLIFLKKLTTSAEIFFELKDVFSVVLKCLCAPLCIGLFCSFGYRNASCRYLL